MTAPRTAHRTSRPRAWPVVVVALGRVGAEELVGRSLGIGLTPEAIHLHFEFASALAETPDQAPKPAVFERVQLLDSALTLLDLGHCLNIDAPVVHLDRAPPPRARSADLRRERAPSEALVSFPPCTSGASSTQLH